MPAARLCKNGEMSHYFLKKTPKNYQKTTTNTPPKNQQTTTHQNMLRYASGKMFSFILDISVANHSKKKKKICNIFQFIGCLEVRNRASEDAALEPSGQLQIS